MPSPHPASSARLRRPRRRPGGTSAQKGPPGSRAVPGGSVPSPREGRAALATSPSVSSLTCLKPACRVGSTRPAEGHRAPLTTEGPTNRWDSAAPHVNPVRPGVPPGLLPCSHPLPRRGRRCGTWAPPGPAGSRCSHVNWPRAPSTAAGPHGRFPARGGRHWRLLQLYAEVLHVANDGEGPESSVL